MWRIEGSVLIRFQHLDPVETGHLDIEEDEVWLAGSDRGQGGEPIVDVHGPMPIAVEVLRKETAVQRIVIDDEDVSGTSVHRVSWLGRSWLGPPIVARVRPAEKECLTRFTTRATAHRARDASAEWISTASDEPWMDRPADMAIKQRARDPSVPDPAE